MQRLLIARSGSTVNGNGRVQHCPTCMLLQLFLSPSRFPAPSSRVPGQYDT